MAQTPPAEPPTVPHGGAPRSAFSHCRTYLLCSAARRKGHGRKMTRTKSRRRFPSDGCPGPLGDPLVCAPFLDDGMIRVQLNQASSQRIESAGQHQSRAASFPSPLAGDTSRGGSRVHKPASTKCTARNRCPIAPAARHRACSETAACRFQTTC